MGSLVERHSRDFGGEKELNEKKEVCFRNILFSSFNNDGGWIFYFLF